ncbi:yeats family-domain-containing protein [Thamnocephalis sphaerospora]|uniref:Protein AF-9 homolog n=1 Tax=Thamnocephalis sphaerospora TaxID=78915 RepID=A0A4P9XQ60_9FUNG|nr:yeats family-domain-containing protein [Thamnocephalis sphaerospora]|eukprot:RKP08156.1 yeats family-domain-containing protein [Thamnocephalis sphaerospora]
MARIIKKRIHVVTRNEIITEREFFAGQYPWRKWQITLFEEEGGRLDDNMPFVSKVVFRLHEDFKRPNRSVTQPPFTVEEEGWGGFEIPISIFFHNSNTRPFTFVHDLRFDYNVYESSVDVEYEDISESSSSDEDASPPREKGRLARKTPKLSQSDSDEPQTERQNLPDEAVPEIATLLGSEDSNGEMMGPVRGGLGDNGHILHWWTRAADTTSAG